MPLVRFVTAPGGSLHSDGGHGVALFQEPGVCAGRRPFRFRSEPLFEGRQHLQGRNGLLKPKTLRAGLVGVFWLSADGGGSLLAAALAGSLNFIQAWPGPRTSPPGAKAGGSIAVDAPGSGQERPPASRGSLRYID